MRNPDSSVQINVQQRAPYSLLFVLFGCHRATLYFPTCALFPVLPFSLRQIELKAIAEVMSLMPAQKEAGVSLVLQS